MQVLLALVILAAAFAALALPLFRPRQHAMMAATGTLGDLVAQRNGIYATLRDLDLDYQIGKLDTADYQARRALYLERAAAILEQLDALCSPSLPSGQEQIADEARQRELSGEIEREVAVLRESTRTVRSNGHVRHRTPAKQQDPGPFCTQCGKRVRPGDRFCANCGQALS